MALTRNCSNSNCKRSKSLIVELLFIYIIYIFKFNITPGPPRCGLERGMVLEGVWSRKGSFSTAARSSRPKSAAAPQKKSLTMRQTCIVERDARRIIPSSPVLSCDDTEYVRDERLPAGGGGTESRPSTNAVGEIRFAVARTVLPPRRFAL